VVLCSTLLENSEAFPLKKFIQLEEEKVQLRNEMVQKTNLIAFQLDRQDQCIRRENIFI